MDERNDLPRFAHAFFKWYCMEEKYEELHGDLEEFYRERVEEHGLSIARRKYLFDVLRCCRPYAWKKFNGQTNSNMFMFIIMFRNYLKTSFRSLLKNPLSSSINVFGLSVAIGICLLVYTFLIWDHSIDRFHENKNEVVLTTYFLDRDGVVEQNGQTPIPLGNMLREDFSHIKKVCRIEDQSVIVKFEENVFQEKVRYTDPEFLEMFTFPLKWGSAASLLDLNNIILSGEMAEKYFGNANPVGKDMLIKFSENNSKTFKVSGVAEEFPKAHDIDFQFLINFDNLPIGSPGFDLTDWRSFLGATFIQLDDAKNLPSIQQGMQKYKDLQNAVQQDWVVSSFKFEQLTTLHQHSGNIRDAITYDGNLEGRIGLTIIGLFMITLACLNYINIAIVSATKRLKEIGVRKSVGAGKKQIVSQFLIENLVVSFFAVVIGFLIGITIIIPWFVQFTGWQLELNMLDLNVWIFFVAILMVTGIASGIYPAFYISSFQTTKIFKGSVEFGKKNPLTKLFLGIQLVLACITIACGVIFTQNAAFQSQRSWGYNPKSVLYSNVPDHAAFEKLRAAMLQDPNVISIAGSNHHLGKNKTNTIIHLPERQYEVDELSVDANYFETMGLTLKTGRLFNNYVGSDKQAIIVNELFVKNLSLENPVGESFRIDNSKYEIVGVVNDFHMYDFFSQMKPTIFRVVNEENIQYLSMKVSPGSELEVYNSLKENWLLLYPETPFQGGHQEDVFMRYNTSLKKSSTFNKILASIAVILASLGFYGLVSLNVSRRVREFSIKKVLGAGLHHIALNVISQYVFLACIALLIGAPLSYYFSKAYLNMLFAYSMPMGISGVLIAIIILIGVLLTIVAIQVRKASVTKPVDGLKAE